MPAPKVTLNDPAPETTGIIAGFTFEALGSIANAREISEAAISCYVGDREIHKDTLQKAIQMQGRDHSARLLRILDGSLYYIVEQHLVSRGPSANRSVYVGTVRISPTHCRADIFFDKSESQTTTTMTSGEPFGMDK